jgi:inhibitor of cysteine peptidase
VKLFANTASTGFLWSNPAQLSNPDVLEQTDHVYVPAASSDPGAGGQDVWTFKAIGRGTCSIYTEYKGAFDTVPTWTFALTVTVM